MLIVQSMDVGLFLYPLFLFLHGYTIFWSKDNGIPFTILDFILLITVSINFLR